MKTISFEYSINGKKFILYPYNTEQEKNLLLMSELNSEFSLDSLFRILKDNIEVENISDLTNKEKVYILLKLREHSVGEQINVTLTCTECKKKFESSIDIQKIKVNEQKEIIINNTVYKSNDIIDYSDFVTYENMHLFLKTSLSPEVFEETLDDMSSRDQKSLKDFISENKNVIDFEATCKCTFCKASNKTSFYNHKFVISAMSEDSIINIYKTINFLVYSGHYTKSDVENMIPFERNIYLGLVTENIEKQNAAAAAK